MPKTGIVLSQRYLEHETGPHHPECPERIAAILRRFSEIDLYARAELITPTPIDPELLESVHADYYIDKFRYTCAHEAGFLDSPECPVCPATFEIAGLAAGGVINAVDAVLAGRLTNAFCAVRPPGHHAERAHAMGFCYFNNVAIAAEYLMARHGIRRVAILDWDVHHGNGTQHHFESDPNVLYVSIHQDPRTIFPGTGFANEIGIGPAMNTTLNVPMPPNAGDDEYRRAFDRQILPALRRFRPGFLLISAGFDGHRDDPLAHLALSTEGYAWMTRVARELAEELCAGRLVSVLEGGYNLAALADCAQAHVEMLMDAGGG